MHDFPATGRGLYASKESAIILIPKAPSNYPRAVFCLLSAHLSGNCPDGRTMVMRWLNLTLPTAAENLALDEALLEEAEASQTPAETLRVWEPAQLMVVVGRSSRIEGEVHGSVCRELGVPIVRRVSGGAAVLSGPGCLMYAVVLNHRLRAMRTVDQMHQFVLDKLAAALRPLVPGVGCRGISDLAIDGRKCSGNSVRVKHNHLLYHGTLLYEFPLDLIHRCLAMPPRQPAYRNDRPHADFVANLAVPAEAIRAALATAWDAHEPLADWPEDRTARLAAEKYSRSHWNECGENLPCTIPRS
jgi:lipoate---protein ligase